MNNKVLTMNKIRILYLGAFGKHCSDPYRVIGIKESGLYDLVGSFDYRELKKSFGDLFDFRINDLIKNLKPDVLLMNKAELITAGDVKLWKQFHPNLIIAYWYGDMRDTIADYVKDKLPVVDAFMTNCDDEFYIDGLEQCGIDRKKIFFSHTATDTTVFRPYSDNNKIYDIIFFGGNYGNKFPDSDIRLEFIHKLINIGKYRVKIYGRNWAQLGDSEQPVYGNDFSRKASQAKIILGFNSFLNIHGYTSNRIWNSMACGFHLTHKYSGIQEVFKKEVHLDWFDGYTDMVKKIDYYLIHPLEREKIFQAGRQEISTKHTYSLRAVEMYSIFKTLIKEKTSVKI